MQIEVAAKVTSSPNPALADAFMQFILSDDFQSVIPTTNWMYPVTDVPLPEGYANLSIPSKALSFADQEVAKQRRSWIREWQHALTF